MTTTYRTAAAPDIKAGDVITALIHPSGTHYGIRTEETGAKDRGRERVTVWAGAFMSQYEAEGTAREGATFYTLYDFNGKRFRANLPDGVMAPRTSDNYERIDTAISERYAHHCRDMGYTTVGNTVY